MTDTTTDQNDTEPTTTSTADARPLSDLTGVQRDLLRTIAALEEPAGVDVIDSLRADYGQRLSGPYIALEQLVDKGYVEERASSHDRRTNKYTLTPRGRRELLAHRRWFCSAWGEM